MEFVSIKKNYIYILLRCSFLYPNVHKTENLQEYFFSDNIDIW